MAEVEASRLFVSSRPGQSSGAFSGGPGTVKGRLSYGLNEKAVNMQQSASVLEARRTIEANYRQDILGLRGEQWNGSVSPDLQRGKYSVKASDQRLTNNYTPSNIQAEDLRRTKGTTFTQGPRGPQAFDRGTAEWGITSSSWTSSTLTPDAVETRKRLEEVNARSKLHSTATTSLLVSTSNVQYVSPIGRQQRIIDEIRDKKANSGVDYDGLVRQYGPEGADHMVHIMQLQQQKQEKQGAGGGGTARRYKAPKQDIEDVRALGDYPSDAEEGVEGVEEQQAEL